jgi:Family of unknown function (DUF6152)
MRTSFALVAAVSALAVTALPLSAHHSFAAEYDGSKQVTLKGKVTQVEWVNPHSWIHIDVTGDDGKVANWACETAPPNGLYRQGWRKNSIKEGDEVIIEGYLAKDGSHTMTARTVQTPDGKRLFAGSPSDGGPQSQKFPGK